MKKLLFVVSLVAFCVFTAATVNAQEVKLGGVVSGFGAWVGGSDFNDEIDYIDDLQGQSASNLIRFGFSIGPTIEVGLTENFAVRTAVQYARRGGGFEVTEDGGPGQLTYTETGNFLDIPVYLKPRFPVDAGLSIHVLLGPQLSLIVGDVEGKENFEDNGQSETYSVTGEPDNRLIFGPTVGAGVAANIGVGELHVDLLYFRSLNSGADDFTDPATGETVEGALIQNLGLSLGFMTPL